MNDFGGDVAILGAGLIGLATAFELASRGATVRVFDTSSEPSRGASWAAAGMLAPRTEHLPDREMLELCEKSLSLYPDFIDRLRQFADVDPWLRLDGILNVAFDEEHADDNDVHNGTDGQHQPPERDDRIRARPVRIQHGRRACASGR